MINKLCIIGVGMIGGSLALALREAGFCSHVVGAGRNAERLQKAQSIGLIDSYETDYAKAVEGADVVLVAVPLDVMQTVFEKIKAHLAKDTIITDVGSAKACVINAAKTVFGEIPPQLVPGHPIAGKEKSGFEAAQIDLFNKHRIILTPPANVNANALKTIEAMWQATGACVENMTVEHHDTVLAATSHLPHMLAYGLVDSLLRLDNVDQIFRYAAGGFRDFTRIASSDPVMWRDICLHNKDALLVMLKHFQKDMDMLTNAIEQSDAEMIETVFKRAKTARDEFAK